MIPDLVEIASLIGDESRAAMLMYLADGRSLPANELARAAGVTPQTASAHLAKMVHGGLLVAEPYGRHRYYRLANAEVGLALESLNAIANPKPIRSLRQSEQVRALRFARTCYDHLAGDLGVALTDMMREGGLIQEVGRNYVVTVDGERWFQGFDIDLDALRRSRRHFARQCLDWSARRHHLAGALGSAMMNRLIELKWIERIPGGRAVRVTETGFRELERDLKISLSNALR